MKDDHIKQSDLLEKCYLFFYNHGYARSRASFCRRYLKRSGIYMAKLSEDRQPSATVWAKLLVALMEIKGNLISVEQKHDARRLFKQVKQLIEEI